MVNVEELWRQFDYDKSSGLFTRRSTGKIASTNAGDGYVGINLNYRCYRAHRMAWLYMTGDMPKGHIDHIDGDRTNNRWSNLRDVPISINNTNRRTAYRNNKIGLLGVVEEVRSGKTMFKACLRIAGKTFTIGRFRTAEEAHEHYVWYKRMFH